MGFGAALQLYACACCNAWQLHRSVHASAKMTTAIMVLDSFKIYAVGYVPRPGPNYIYIYIYIYRF